MMKPISKIIFSALLAITSYNAAAEMQGKDFVSNHAEDIKQSSLQLSLFPGIAKAPKPQTVFHMAEQPRDVDGILNLNSSLSGDIETTAGKQYLDDIEVTTNNILEIRF